MNSAIWLLLTIGLLLVSHTSSENGMVIPIPLDDGPRNKDTNVNVDLNFGIGGNCTVTELIIGPDDGIKYVESSVKKAKPQLTQIPIIPTICNSGGTISIPAQNANIKLFKHDHLIVPFLIMRYILDFAGNCTELLPGETLFAITPKPQTTQKRKFEKFGEYIKVNLCSYEYDDGRSCGVLCGLLGYVKYACSDLELCHCFVKSADATKTKEMKMVHTNQKPGTTVGVIFKTQGCSDNNECAIYCTMQKFEGYECLNDVNCHCFLLTR